MGVGHFVTPERRSEFFAAYRAAMDALPDPESEHDVDTGFGTVHVHRFSCRQAPPIVLLHGRTGTSAMWQPNVAALAERYPVYAVDLLGEPGRSVQTVPIRSAADHSRWLDQTLAALGLRGAHLIGASFGGWLALNQAFHAPNRVSSVSLLDPVRTLAPLPMRMMFAALGALPIAPEPVRERFLNWLSGGRAVPGNDPTARVIAAGMRAYRVSLPVPAYPSDEQLRSITSPVLAFVSGKSTVHDPRKAVDRATRLIPNAQVELWPTASHAISAECADAVNTRLLDFLDHPTSAESPS